MNQVQSQERLVARDDTNPRAFCARYRPQPGIWDEFVDATGEPRPAAQALVAFLDQLGPAGLRQRAEQSRQLVRDHGVTYSVPNDGRPNDQPWKLDVLPSLIDAAEFAGLAAGLAARARLLDRILKDLYGPQRLVREGYLPARLVLGNPTFLRPCHGLDTRSYVQLYAADFVRTSTGSFCVLRDRSQAPTGAGYALENRLVVSQALAEPFRQGNVLRMASFFRTMRETLAGLSPVPREDPRIVLLSAGSYSPTYFEQAFLAQYLGYPLVEGGDLTVREHRVFLKTLGGLSPVDVILRQPEDDYCDPLELRPDSQLGVPGLVEATRARQVAVANSLGSGLAQSPALLPFLPRIAREFFGEELALDCAPAFWCGEERSLEHALAHADAMVFRPSWAGAGPGLAFAGGMGTEAREALLSQVRAQPDRFVAQECVALSRVPVLVEDEIRPRSSVMRAFVILSGDECAVMPGGLSLSDAAPSGDGAANIAIAQGETAKDLWVRGEAQVEHFSLLPPATRSVELSRGGADLPSRSADNLFWFGRYAERAEAVARLARHLLSRLAEEGEARLALSPAMPTLLQVMASATESKPLDVAQEQPLAWLARALCALDASGSLYSTLRAAMRSAAAVRDRLSTDTFRVLGALGDEADRAAGLARQPGLGALTGFLDRVVTSLSALSGLAMESMTRGHGWRFLDMGRRLERALQLLSLLRAAFATGAESESTLLEALLAVADSSISYRRRYLAGLHPAAVVDLLLVDDGNPRAVLFQIAALREHLRHLTHDSAVARLRPEERLALAALTRLQLLDVVPACEAPAAGEPPPLHAILQAIEADLSLLSAELCGGYLSHALMPRALSGALGGV